MRAPLMFAIALTLASTIPIETRAEETVMEKLAGIYTYVSGKDGTLIVPKERLTGLVKIAKDRMTLVDDKDAEVFVIAYEIKSDKAPYRVALTTVRSSMKDAEGSKAVGLLKLEGDTLTIMYDYGDDAVYPEAFVPQTDKQHLFVLKKKADAK